METILSKLLQLLPHGATVNTYNRGEVLEVDWPDHGITLLMNDEEVMFTQHDGYRTTVAWDALWRDYTIKQMADRIKFYFQ